MSENFDALGPDRVSDRESFLAFVAALAEDRRAASASRSPNALEAGGWQNVTIEDFLDAATAWAESTEMGERQGLPATPSWQGFAAFLYCGKIYE